MPSRRVVPAHHRASASHGSRDGRAPRRRALLRLAFGRLAAAGASIRAVADTGRRREPALHAGDAIARIEVLRPYVEKIVAQFLEIEPAKLVVGDDGTIPVSRGSARYIVRLLDAEPGPIVQVYSCLLTGNKSSPKLLAKINEINASIWFGRMFHADDQVVLAAEMVAETLDKEEVAAACNNIGAIADARDTELKAEFGGSMSFADEPAKTADGETPAEV
jgi:Putative bacterial sensory transduction regulator